MISFDYEYYMKIIEFIKNSSEEINENINDLIEDTVKAQEKNYLKVNPFSIGIDEVKIGDNFLFTPENNKMSFINPVKLEIKGNWIKQSNPNYLKNSVIDKKNKDNYLNYLYSVFLTIVQLKKIDLKILYKKDIAENDFKDSEIPSFKWFRNNYVINTDTILNNRICVDNNIDSNNRVLTISKIKELTGIDFTTKKAKIYLDNFCSINNGIIISEKTINIVTDKIIKFELSNVQSNEINNFNSIVTDEGIKKTFVTKDLNNLKQINIKSYGEQNSVLSLDDYLQYCQNESFTENNTLKVATNVNMHLFNAFPSFPANTISDEIYTFISKDSITKEDILLFLYKITGVDFSDIINFNDSQKAEIQEKIKNIKKIEGVPASINLIDFIYYTINFLYSDNETFSFKEVDKDFKEKSVYFYDKNNFTLNYPCSFNNPDDYIAKKDLLDYAVDMKTAITNTKYF